MSRPRLTDLHLPPGIRRKVGKKRETYYTQIKGPDGTKIYRYLGANLEAAIEALRVPTRLHSPEVMRAWCRDLAQQCRSRSKTIGVECSLDSQSIAAMVEAQKFRCAISGILFTDANKDNFRIRPYRPSIDRLDCKKGYVSDNVRVVCAYINLALNQFGEQMIREAFRKRYVKGPKTD